MVLYIIYRVNNFDTETCGFGTFHWWRIPCYTQDLLGWKECSVLQAKEKFFCMQIRMDGKLSQTELSSLRITIYL